MFSFQAIKHITTADGGMLCIKNKNLMEKAKRIRWFGIDREKKQKSRLFSFKKSFNRNSFESKFLFLDNT